MREFILCCSNVIHVNIGHPVALCGIKSFGSLMVSVATGFINVLCLYCASSSMLMNSAMEQIIHFNMKIGRGVDPSVSKLTKKNIITLICCLSY